MSGTPNTVQRAFRWRADTSSVDVAATWYTTTESSNYAVTPGVPCRLRFGIQNTGTGTTGNVAWSLRYSYNGGAFTALSATSSYVKTSSAASVSADNTTIAVQQLSSAATGSFSSGQYDNSGLTGNVPILAGNFTEFEFGIVFVSSQVTAGTTVQFEVYGSGAPLNTYSAVPTKQIPWYGTGTPTAGSATAAGAGKSQSAGTGALSVTQRATVAAAGKSQSSGTGNLVVANPAVIAGAGRTATVDNGTGALAAQSATLAGAALSKSQGTGALVAQSAVAAGAAKSQSTGTAALVAQSAIIAGTGTAFTPVTGDLITQPAIIAGEGNVVVVPVGAGDLVAQSAIINGNGFATAAGALASGALDAQAATVASEGTSESIGSGDLVAQDATLAGEALSGSAGDGALVCNPATAAGEAVSGSNASGALAAQAAAVTGNGQVSGTALGSGSLVINQATLSGLGTALTTFRGKAIISIWESR